MQIYDTTGKDSPSIRVGGELLSLRIPKVMGIINVTPDSFYPGSRTAEASAIRKRVEAIVSEGGDIIDIGGYSSRPGARDVSVEEEYRRVAKGLEIIREMYPDAIVSVDTFRSEVARRCVEEWGVAIINDISGGDLDPGMWETVASLGVAYVLMHMRGNPETMNSLARYDDVAAEVLSLLAFKCSRLHELGVADVIIDPGFGFAKNVEDNYRLLGELREFRILGPVLAGMSRKRMVYTPLGVTAEEAGNGTTVVNTIALLNGADMLRVHDVRAAVEAVTLTEMYRDSLGRNK